MLAAVTLEMPDFRSQTVRRKSEAAYLHPVSGIRSSGSGMHDPECGTRSPGSRMQNPGSWPVVPLGHRSWPNLLSVDRSAPLGHHSLHIPPYTEYVQAQREVKSYVSKAHAHLDGTTSYAVKESVR